MQLEQLKAAGCELIFKEKVTGTRADRKELMVPAGRRSDLVIKLVVIRIDRLARRSSASLPFSSECSMLAAISCLLRSPWPTPQAAPADCFCRPGRRRGRRTRDDFEPHGGGSCAIDQAYGSTRNYACPTGRGFSRARKMGSSHSAIARSFICEPYDHSEIAVARLPTRRSRLDTTDACRSSA